MSKTKRPTVRDRAGAASSPPQHDLVVIFDAIRPDDLHRATEEFASSLAELATESRPELARTILGLSAEHHVPSEAIAVELQTWLQYILVELQSRALPQTSHGSDTYLLTSIAENMALSIGALGPALAEIETPVSPQLARSVAATENAWRELEAEFGLLSSREVSELVGSKSPNRSFASEQRSRGKMVAVKRPGGLRYPGFQIDRTEHAIRPVMAELIRVAEAAGRSEASLALWMTSRTGYLDGDRPVDQLSHPEKVVEAAQQSFNVQW